MINIFLTLIILMIGLSRNEKPVLLFCTLTGFFNVVGLLIPDESGMLYYLAAAINSLIIIKLLGKLNKINGLVLSLQEICKLSILVNFFGWFLWMLYLPPTIYDNVFTMIYCCAIIILVSGFQNGYRNFTLDNWISRLCCDYSQSRHDLQTNEETKRL